MEDKQKVKVVFEFDRSEYDATLFLMGQKKSEDTDTIWKAMSEEPVMADPDLLGKDSLAFKTMIVAVTMLSVENKARGLS